MVEVRYQFGTAARGVLLGLRPAQMAGAVAGLALAGLALAAGAPPPVAACALVAAAIWCWARLGDRRLHEWLGATLRHGRVVSEGRRWIADMPSVTVGPAFRPATHTRRCPGLPPELGALRLAEAKAEGMRIGLAVAPGRTATVVLAMRGPEGFALAEPEEQAGLVAQWSDVLAGLGSGIPSLRRACWVERAEPGAGATERWSLAPLRCPAADDFRALRAEIARHAIRHETYLGIQVQGRGSQLADAAAGAAHHAAGLLGAAEIAARPLARHDLARLIGRWADPVAGDKAVVPDALACDASPVQGRELGWSEARIDGCLHRSWVVSAWPASPVGPAWLEPLLAAAPAGVSRSFAVHLRPVPPALAARRARAGRLNAHLDQAQRRRWGFDIGARQDAELAEAARREEELVAGHAAHRVIAVVGLSASERATLDAGATALEQAATAAGLELRCCYGSQADGWAATLPLCRVREAKGS